MKNLLCRWFGVSTRPSNTARKPKVHLGCEGLEARWTPAANFGSIDHDRLKQLTNNPPQQSQNRPVQQPSKKAEIVAQVAGDATRQSRTVGLGNVARDNRR